MSKERLSDFEKICKSLDTWKSDSKGKEIELARVTVNAYVGQDNDKLLKLKAEAQKGDYELYLSQNVSQIALLMGLLSIGLDAIDELYENSILTALSVVFLIIAIGATYYVCYWSKKFNYINYWRTYIMLIIEEVEREKEEKRRAIS